MPGEPLLPCRVCSRQPTEKRQTFPARTLIRCHHHTRNALHTVLVFYADRHRAVAAWNRLNGHDAARGGA